MMHSIDYRAVFNTVGRFEDMNSGAALDQRSENVFEITAGLVLE